jgi:IclR family acetate operon transcriptional repressor
VFARSAGTPGPASTENSHTTSEGLLQDIKLCRGRGYALDEGEQETGVRRFAVPVPDAPSLTAISISGPAVRVTLKSAPKVTPLLKRVARDIASEFDRDTAVYSFGALLYVDDRPAWPYPLTPTRWRSALAASEPPQQGNW